ncbi:MAG: phage major capsid protein [Brevundimonas sp.]|uniref:phage major capsid protein n=1 Tax=Brevundimonas sp. TaxID=1871086 RepID=UPI002736A29D|nr:phage major capsid protein [Brevundimonas sp.]MDP3378941.1 phage major capsid protein [Brevundimonas sp.]
MNCLPPLETKNAPDDAADEVKDALAALTQSVDEKVTEATAKAQKAHTDEIKALRGEIAALKRPGAEDGDTEDKPEVKAFWGFVRTGTEGLQPDERKALIVSDDTRGGFLAPEQFEAQLQKELVEISPIRQAARVTQTTAGRVVWPRRTGTITARWVGETEERTRTEPTYGQAAIDVHEMAAYIDVSNWLLEDSAIDLAAELSSDFAEEFGRLEGEAFLAGDGIKKPVGILNDASIPTVPNGHATAVSADALIRLMYDLPATYRNRGSWLLNGGTIAEYRLLKDANGRFLWQDSIQVGQPASLLGRPVIEAVDMPGIEADATPVIYGDFNTGHRIVDRVGLSVLRDPYTVATEGLVRFHGRRRVGSGVVRPDAFRKLKMATS